MSRDTAAPPNPAAPAAQDDARSGSRLRAMLDDVGALRNPLYRRFWLGSLGAVAGTQFVILATGWLVVDGLGGSPLDLGYVGAATAVPTIAVNLFGGVLADRMDRRMLLIVTSIISALLIGVLAVLDATGSVAIWHVVAISAALGLVYGVDWPVRNAFFPQLIDEEHMISAVALNSVVWQGTRIVSPAIAGIAIAVFGTAFVFAAATIGFVVMLVVLLALHVERAVSRQRRAVARELFEGVVFIARERLFAALMLLTYTTTFFAMSYIFLMPLMADELGIGPTGYGFMLSAIGVGAVSGTVLSFRLQHIAGLGPMMLTASLGSSLFVFLFAWSPVYPISVALTFCAGITNSIFLITSMTVMQLRVPEELRGRVMGIHAITFSLISLGGLVGGAIANAFDVRVAIAVGACVLACVTLIVTATQPEVRHIRTHAAPPRA